MVLYCILYMRVGYKFKVLQLLEFSSDADCHVSVSGRVFRLCCELQHWTALPCWIRWPGTDYLPWAVDSGSNDSLSLSLSICHESLSHPTLHIWAWHPDCLMICPASSVCFLLHLSFSEGCTCLASQSLLSGQDSSHSGSGTHLEDVSADFSLPLFHYLVLFQISRQATSWTGGLSRYVSCCPESVLILGYSSSFALWLCFYSFSFLVFFCSHFYRVFVFISSL